MISLSKQTLYSKEPLSAHSGGERVLHSSRVFPPLCHRHIVMKMELELALTCAVFSVGHYPLNIKSVSFEFKETLLRVNVHCATENGTVERDKMELICLQ